MSGYGFDLGTHSCCAAFLHRKRPELIRHGEGVNRSLEWVWPSYVADLNGELASGTVAWKYWLDGGKYGVFYAVKRYCGLSVADARKKKEQPGIGVEATEGGMVLLEAGGSLRTPRELLSSLISTGRRDAAQRAEERGKSFSDKVVIGVPSEFTAIQRNVIRLAAIDAGFSPDSVTLCDEPTLAALAELHGFPESADVMRVIVFDMGAGTTDVVALELSKREGRWSAVEVCAPRGGAFGGTEIDLRMYEEYPLPPETTRTDLDDWARAKHELSYKESTSLRNKRVFRAEFEQDVLEPTLQKCETLMHEAVISIPDFVASLDAVVFVGGPSCTPAIRHAVLEQLERLGAPSEELRVLPDLQEDRNSPRTLVARGAALMAAGVVEVVGIVEKNGIAQCSFETSGKNVLDTLVAPGTAWNSDSEPVRFDFSVTGRVSCYNILLCELPPAGRESLRGRTFPTFPPIQVFRESEGTESWHLFCELKVDVTRRLLVRTKQSKDEDFPPKWRPVARVPDRNSTFTYSDRSASVATQPARAPRPPPSIETLKLALSDFGPDCRIDDLVPDSPQVGRVECRRLANRAMDRIASAHGDGLLAMELAKKAQAAVLTWLGTS